MIAWMMNDLYKKNPTESNIILAQEEASNATAV